MLVLSLGVLFRGFNASRFVLYLCVLIFVILLALRLDSYINISYVLVFGPLFVCNGIAFLGAFIGFIFFFLQPPPPSDTALRSDFLGMLLTTVQHALLFSFEYFAAHKLDLLAAAEHQKQSPVLAPWVIVFAPLFLQCCLAIFVSIWAVRHEKSFEFELFFSLNVIEFVFVAFKLDKQVDWSWAVVFIPLWVVLSLSVVGVLYALILAVLLARSRHLLPAHRRNHMYGAILHTLLVVPSLVSLVLLTGKLDAPRWPAPSASKDFSFSLVVLPLDVSLFCLLLMSFTSRGGNVWWFALRRPFCSFVLDTCPCLRQYANVSYKVGMAESGRSQNENTPPPLLEDADRPVRAVAPITSIDLPD